MLEYHHHLAGLGKQYQVLKYTGSAEQLCIRWSVVIVWHHHDVVLKRLLMHNHVQQTMDVLNGLGQQTVNQSLHLGKVLLTVEFVAAFSTASAKRCTNVHDILMLSPSLNLK